MHRITEAELKQISAGILADREIIIKHNPIGTESEILLWMLMSCLVSYLSLTDSETPCFTGKPNAETYENAIRFILKHRKSEPFNEAEYIGRLLSP